MFLLDETIGCVLLDYLFRWGVTTFFAIPGAHIDSLLKLVATDARFKLILAADELGAGYMADGFFRMKSVPCAVASINGPGITNLVTSMVNSEVDRSFVIYISGDSPTFLKGKNAFQSSEPAVSNTGAIIRAALQHSFQIDTPRALIDCTLEIDRLLNQKIECPIYINLPCDLVDMPFDLSSTGDSIDFIDSNVQKSVEVKKHIAPVQSFKTIAFIGSSIRHIENFKLILDFCIQHSIPIVLTMSAKAFTPLVPESLYLGIFGYAGSTLAIEKILDPELQTLLVIGADLDERNTMAWNKGFFAPARRIIHFDLYQSGPVEYHRLNEIHQVEKVTSGSWLEVVCILDKLFDDCISNPFNAYQESTGTKNTIKNGSVSTSVLESSSDLLTLFEAIKIMNQSAGQDSALFVDSGDHRIYASQYWNPSTQHSFFTSAKLAPMGWAISAAIGASFADPNRYMWVLTGDGCMMMQGINLAVAARYKRKVTFFVSNNRSYGRIAARLQAVSVDIRESISALPTISWVTFAESLGVKGVQVTKKVQLEKAILQARSVEGPFLIDLAVADDKCISHYRSVFSSASKSFIEKYHQDIKDERDPDEKQD